MPLTTQQIRYLSKYNPSLGKADLGNLVAALQDGPDDSEIGFYGATPVAQAAAPTAANADAVDATWDADAAAVVNNMRTRLNEVVTALRNLGLMA